MSKLKKNLGYQTLYQILNTCIPLITSPYLARVLGAEKQGIFSYSQSVVNYFTLFAMLGVVNYGTRAIADCGADKEKRSRTFWNIYILQTACTLISTGIYIIYLTQFCSQNILIAFLQIFYLFGSFVDINWLFFGVEKFKVTASRSMSIRICSVFLILTLVKNPDDLWVYTTIMAGSTFLSNAILWFFASKEIDFKAISSISSAEIISHIKPNLVLFIPLLAMSVYHIMDKTMLGILSSYEQVGYYYNADKIINIPVGILTGVGTVMLPRMSALNKEGKQQEAEKLFFLSIELIIAVSVAMASGIAAISKEFTPVFFGKGFDECVGLIMALSPVLVIKGLSNVARMQYLIPQKKEKIFIESVFLGAGVNFVANWALILKMGALGAVIGTLLAEIVSCAWQYIKMNKYISCSKTFFKSLIYVLFGAAMFVAVRKAAMYLNGGITALFLEILTGVIAYGVMCLIYWKVTKNEIARLIIKKL